MKEIRILNLYVDLLDLYGDRQNVYALCRRIREAGDSVTVTDAGIGDEIKPKEFDLIYVGHGKSRNLSAAARHFVNYGDEIGNSIENGSVWIATGNSRLLFGRDFENCDGNIQSGIDFFDYTGCETNKVFVSDMLLHPVFDRNASAYGFVNRTSYIEGINTSPLFEVELGCGDGNQPDGSEGTLYKNFYATWCMGPVIARNPCMMAEILKKLGINSDACDFKLENKALNIVFEDLKRRK